MHCSLHISTIAGFSKPPFERVQKHCKAGCQLKKIPHDLLMENTHSTYYVLFPPVLMTLFLVSQHRIWRYVYTCTVGEDELQVSVVVLDSDTMQSLILSPSSCGGPSY